MTERKLATIRKIDDVNPIEGADAIEVATIGGWKVVIKKDEYEVGSLAIYCEIDSWIPTALAPFLSKGKEPRTYNGVKGEKLRTVKLRGQLSQGLLLPLSVLGPQEDIFSISTGCIGADVTEELGIQKYEAPIPAELSGQAAGTFPTFIQKTDQERCQNLYEDIFVKNADAYYEVTMKLDGTSFTGFNYNNVQGVCSRNWEMKINEENSNNTLVRLFVDSGMQELFRQINRNIAIQAELMGPKIQGNREQLNTATLFVFDIYDIDKAAYFPPKERRDLLDELWTLGLDKKMVQHVPIIAYEANLSDTLGIKNIKDLLKFADGPSIVHPVREGEVFKRLDGGFSFKVISDNFLLKEKD